MGELSRKAFLRRAAVLAAGGATGALGYAAAAASEKGKGRGEEMGKGHNHHPTTVTTTPVVRTFPASFYTGPLGGNNILPTGSGAFLGAQFGGVGYSKAQERTQLQARAALMGRQWDIFHFHYDGGGTYGGTFGCEDPTDTLGSAPGGVTQEQYAINNGMHPSAVWSPNYTIAQVNAGDADAIFTKMGTYWATFKPHRIMLRLFHEFDAASYPWGYGYGGTEFPTGPQFVSAWQRAISQIHGAGGTNVGFWWCPNEYLGGLDRTTMNARYPGDAYVDWVGADCYNHLVGFSTPLHEFWASWADIWNYGQDWGAGYCHYDIYCRTAGDPLRAVSGTKGWTGTPYTKPFVVGETSTMFDDAGDSVRKANWFRGVVQDAKGLASMPNCVGVCFYDADVSAGPGSDFDWRVGSNASAADTVGTDPHATTITGFIEMARSPLIRGR